MVNQELEERGVSQNVFQQLSTFVSVCGALQAIHLQACQHGACSRAATMHVGRYMHSRLSLSSCLRSRPLREGLGGAVCFMQGHAAPEPSPPQHASLQQASHCTVLHAAPRSRCRTPPPFSCSSGNAGLRGACHHGMQHGPGPGPGSGWPPYLHMRWDAPMPGWPDLP